MTRWIRNLSFSTKMVVIMVAGLVPVVFLSALYLTEKQAAIVTVERELAGVHRYQNLEAMLLPVGVHEIWSAAALVGEGASDKLQASADDLVRLMNQQAGITDDYGASNDEDAQRWNAVRSAWSSIQAAKPKNISDVIRLHTQLRRKILDYRDYIANTADLLLDSNPITSFMLDATVVQIPNYESDVTELRSRAANVAVAGKSGMADLEEITRTEVLAEGALDQTAVDMRHVTENSAFGATRLDSEQALTQLKNAFEGFRRFVAEHVIGSGGSDSLDAVLQNAGELTAAINSFHDSMQRAVERELRQNINQLQATRDQMLALVAIAVVVGVGLMMLVIGGTVRGMNEVVAVVSRLADGDYTQDIAVHGRDELARAMHALRSMQSKLSAVLSDVKDAAATVATAARQINAGTSDLSTRTEQQAASLEETATSMEQMTATVKQNADNAVLANKLAQAALDQAEHGGSVVKQTIAAMGAIDSSSKRIADIISVIDEIAFQTNLLALNAAVEAARAGDQGRGFAVVASEVRSLAQRSASAAKEIKDLIRDSGGKVDEGSRLVSESGRHLGEIVASVKKVSDVVGEISNASQEQAAGAMEISRAVVQMDASTQQNAAMVEQASAAAASMQDQAQRLAELTTYFRLAAAPEPTSERAPALSPAAAALRNDRYVASARDASAQSAPVHELTGNELDEAPVRRYATVPPRRERLSGQIASLHERGEREASRTHPPAAAGADWSEF
jgi:methyl-accepting chemotaxis protein